MRFDCASACLVRLAGFGVSFATLRLMVAAGNAPKVHTSGESSAELRHHRNRMQWYPTNAPEIVHASSTCYNYTIPKNPIILMLTCHDLLLSIPPTVSSQPKQL
jgi:hypothetical protein